ncbi:SUMF1/EgtB/PvdO family nonheme iron enzyme [Neolewinella lacunae]|uniref:SUMF1/EgtB/PvdO family nonheme iron enzyme n=1 Tax=Neolewinella lacunae TaxID=1517758 RepID=A0A923PHY4_9BACT|nr:SUMF1/EgtB/PvdO family nonheme iron enzyme [Neolewinella lacunae]MBC6994463.1 SUMF1/EgtB/PvdO family nonheme iron enzyme [Neolewinella lacunae]MDN3634156.1 SUMF1/EgtB/PvdO family nonheme iron enzyme [Neolewinella lacunae]
MPELPPHLPLPLATFVRRLRAAGFPVDAGREFQLRRVLHERGSEYLGRFADLKYLLAPYVVRNPAEQRQFYVLWDDYLAELELAVAAPSDAAEAESARQSTNRWLRWLPLLVLALVAAFFGKSIYAYFYPATGAPATEVRFAAAPRLPEDTDPRQQVGERLRFLNLTPAGSAEDSAAFRWTVEDLVRDSLVYETTGYDFDYAVTGPAEGTTLRVSLDGSHVASADSVARASSTVDVFCADLPGLAGAQFPTGPLLEATTYRFGVQREADTDYRLIIGTDTLTFPTGAAGLAQVRYRFAEQGIYVAQLTAVRRGNADFCFTTRTENLSVGENLPVLPSLSLRADVPRLVLGIKNWLPLFLLFLGIYLFAYHEQYWKDRRKAGAARSDEALAAAYPIHDKGPYQIPYRSQAGQISVPADFFRIAGLLRVREEGLRRVFDAPATVEATIREGGFPRWRDRASKQPASYLALVKSTDEFHQQDLLLRRLTDFLVAREAALTVYYHQGNFEHFWNDEHPNGWSPAQLRSRYPEHRLLLIGSAHGLVDAYESRQPRLDPAKERWLLNWTRRLVLTTEPVADWSYQEVLLHRQAHLHPLTTAGIQEGLEALNDTEEYQPGPYARWEKQQAHRHPEPSCRYRQWETVAEHRDYLADDPELFRWLTALAVNAQTDWNLTIAIGRALGLEVTHNRLLRLSRIPWLAENRPPTELRLAFLAELPLADEKLAREAVLEELTAVKSQVENSFAAADWSAQSAVHAFALDPQDPQQRRAVEELRRVGFLSGGQLAELDRVASRAQGSQLTETEQDAAPNLTRWLQQSSKENARDRRQQLAGRLGIIVLCLLLFYPMYRFQRQANVLPPGADPTWWQQAKVLDDPALQRNNEAVGIWDRTAALPSDTARTGRTDSLVIAVGKLAEAIELRGGVYPLADSNRLALAYDVSALTLLQFYRMVDEVSPGARPQVQGPEQQQQSEDNFFDNLGDALEGMELAAVDSLHAYLKRALELQVDNTQGNYRHHFAHLLGIAELGRYEAYLKYYGTPNHPAAAQLTRAEGIYWQIDSLTAGSYFDSLTLIAPVNLRTMLERVRAVINQEGGGDIPDPGPVLPASYTLQGRVVDANGQPQPAITVTLSPGGTAVTTNATGRFAFRDLQPALTYRLDLASAAGDQQTLSYQYEERRRGNLGDYRWELAKDPLTTNTDNDIVSQRLAQWGNSQGNYFLYQRGNATEAGQLQDYLTGFWRGNGAGEVLYSARDMAEGLKARYPKVEFSPVRITVENFFFLGQKPSPPAFAREIQALRGGNTALVIAVTQYDDPGFPDIAGMAEKTAEMTEQLRAAGFNVRTILDPTKAEMQVALREYVARPRLGTEQGFVYLSGLLAGDYFLGRDANFREEESLGISNAEIQSFLDATAKNTHQLVIGNFITFTPPSVVPEQTTPRPPAPDMVAVPGGTFQMGDTFGEGYNDELPVHTVTLSPFSLGRYEVTFTEYDLYCESTGREKPDDEGWGRGQYPVINVSWYDAVEYCNWLSEQHGYVPFYQIDGDEVIANWSVNGYRLSTEAEWEYAAREGGKQVRFGNGKNLATTEEINLADRAMFNEKIVHPPYFDGGWYREKTVAVGSLNSPNAFGLHEMSGNVGEWTWDRYDAYPKNTQNNPKGGNQGSNRTTRGGSWLSDPEGCRAADRNYDAPPTRRDRDIGFRIARSSR